MLPITQAGAVGHDDGHGIGSGNLGQPHEGFIYAVYEFGDAGDVNFCAVLVGGLGVLGDGYFVADGEGDVGVVGEGGGGVSAVYKIRLFVGVDILFGIDLPRPIRLKDDHADNGEGVVFKGNTDADDYAIGVGDGLELVKTGIVQGGSQFFCQSWFVAGQGQFGEDDRVCTIGEGEINELVVVFDVGLNVALDRQRLSSGDSHSSDSYRR